MGERQEFDARKERYLKRVVIVEKWQPDKIKKVVKQSKALRKELRLGEVDEVKEEDLMKMRR
jgi:hypothetical protein